MIRIHIICEGQTEEMFVNKILADHFLSKGLYLFPSLVGRPGHKGGNFKFERLLHDARNRLLGDRDSYCTTLFDFYGLPEDFPGKSDALNLPDISEKKLALEQRLTEALTQHIGQSAIRRFIPYVQLYEFEGLLFSRPDVIASEIGLPELAEEFMAIRRRFPSPEHVNNSRETAPSKRIVKLYDGYDKVNDGSLIAREIGLDTIRRECPLFDSWVKRLEALAPGGAQ